MNNFAIETAQSLFENMLNVPQSELETTVMRFREEVKNLGEPERFAVTGDLVLRVQELAWELGDRFGLDCMNLDELEFNLLDCESQMTEKEKRVFDWFMFFQYPWPNGAPNCVLFLVKCFDDKLFFMTPDIILQRTGIDVRAVEQGDDAWHKLRLGVITASEVHNVIAKPRSGKKWPDMKMSYFHTLLAEVCTGVAPEVNAKALAWGKQYENDARTLFEFTSGVNVTESPIIYRDESMRTACSPDGLCSDGNGLELKCPFTSRDFMKFRLGGFEAIKSAYMAQVQYSMWVTRKDAWYFANYDPRMKREGLHYVVVERDEKYMANFDEMVPEFIEKMDVALAEIGFVFGEQWR